MSIIKGVGELKPHLVVKVRPDIKLEDYPHWADIVHTKGYAPTRFIPEVDDILERFGTTVWVTQEHRPQSEHWSPEEMASGLNRLYRLILRREADIPASMVDQISVIPAIESVRMGRVGESPLPELRAQQLSSTTDRASREAIYLSRAHQISRGEPDTTVAVLDTGIAMNHPELQETLLPGYDFVNIIDGAEQFIGDYLGADTDPSDNVGHGTHVAGIIGAQGLNMPEGVAPRCRILPVRVLAAMQRGARRVGAGLVDNIDAGVKWAVDQGADVINMSLGVQHTGGGLPHQDVIDYAQRKGVTVVAATGNDGTEELYYPGAFDSVIAVGASDLLGDVAAFSTFGQQVTLVAPGTQIYSTYLENGYAFSSGTSHAAPFVTGAVALLKSLARKLGHTLTDGQIKHVLIHTADKIGRRFKDRKAGFGRLNLWDALKLTQYRLLD